MLNALGVVLTASAFVKDFGAVIALIGVAMTLLITGRREERRHRRELHARALRAVAEYYEMPFLIRRRRHDEPAAERARLSEKFAAIQAELALSEALIRSDPDPDVRRTYAELVQVLRSNAGRQASLAWNAPPITSDLEMGMQDLLDELTPISAPRVESERAMARSTRTAGQRFRRKPSI